MNNERKETDEQGATPETAREWLAKNYGYEPWQKIWNVYEHKLVEMLTAYASSLRLTDEQLREKVEKVVEAAEAHLLGGSHEGECEYSEDDNEGCCRIHIAKAHERDEKLRSALAEFKGGK